MLSLASCSLAFAGSAPSVTTSLGTVFGTPLPSDSNGATAVNQFLGIPFGEPTKRWEAPVDLTTPYTTSPFNATMWGAACLQVLGPNTTYGSEDCLRLNVWQPATPTETKRAVMVFIYGGSNQFGEAEPYNMSGLAAFHDVVCVNMNYRTGPIGWMAFPEDVAASQSTGNFGILDIQSALRWVRREIGAFGGDPSRVAIHGQSSGGGLVELQYVSPQSDGLFRAAISESGGLSATPLADALRNTKEMGKAVGCKEKGIKECFKALPPLAITSLTYEGSWGPTVDQVTIPRDPAAMLEAGEVNRVDAVVFGAQTNDSFLFLSRAYTTHGESQPNNHPDGDLVYMNASTYTTLLTQSLGSFASRKHKQLALELYPAVTEYPPGRSGTIVNTQSLGRVESDRMLCSNRRRAKQFGANGGRRGFVYRFNYWYKSNPQCSAVPNFHLDYLGSVHQDEVTFVLGQPNFMEQGSCCGRWGLSEGAEGCPKTKSCTACYDEKLGSGYHAYFNAKEFSFARLVGSLWTSFADHGSPIGAGLGGSDWPDVASSKTGSGGIVLDADERGGHAIEQELYEDPKVCQLWDALA